MDHLCAEDSWTHKLVYLSYSLVAKTLHGLGPMDWSQINPTNHARFVEIPEYTRMEKFTSPPKVLQSFTRLCRSH